MEQDLLFRVDRSIYKTGDSISKDPSYCYQDRDDDNKEDKKRIEQEILEPTKPAAKIPRDKALYLFDTLRNHPGAHGVLGDVAEQGDAVGVVLDDGGLKSLAEEVADAQRVGR